jgi:prefoldin subunit 5
VSTKHEYAIRYLQSDVKDLQGQITNLSAQLDKMKDVLDKVVLTANSTYKKKRVLEEVDDFLSTRLNGR